MPHDLRKIEKQNNEKTHGRDETRVRVGGKRFDAQRSKNRVDAIDAHDKDEENAVETGAVVYDVGVETGEPREVEHGCAVPFQ